MEQMLRRQQEEKREHLLRSAYELFLEKGVSKTSVDDIAKRAGTAKGTFYLYFRDKLQAWEAVVMQISNVVLTKAKKELEQKNIPDMVDRILFVADYIIEYFRAHTDVLCMVQRNFSWPMLFRQMQQAEDNTLWQMLEQCFCSPYLSRYTMEEAYRMMFVIVEMVGSISYTSIIHNQPAPIDCMKPILFRSIRKILM